MQDADNWARCPIIKSRYNIIFKGDQMDDEWKPAIVIGCWALMVVFTILANLALIAGACLIVKWIFF